MSETVEVKAQLDKRVYEALKWYIPLTSYGVGRPFEESLSNWISDCVKQDLEAEIGCGCEGAAEQITRNLEAMLKD